jgi:hypothetical protein
LSLLQLNHYFKQPVINSHILTAQRIADKLEDSACGCGFMASVAALKYEQKGMRSSKEDKGKGNPDEEPDRADREETSLVPSDLDIGEGDEEKNEETDLPPAMPPKV